jgi:hypothetical protein
VSVSPEDMKRLHGMRMRLARKQDKKEPCCGNFAIVHVLEGVPELLCSDCGLSRGQLPIEAANWILTVLSFWPEAAKDVHTYSDETLSSFTARRKQAKAMRETIEEAESE